MENKKALIKENCSILDIIDKWGYSSNFRFTFIFIPRKFHIYSTWVYKLSDGNTYNEKSLIIGSQEIREWKIKKLNKNL